MKIRTTLLTLVAIGSGAGVAQAATTLGPALPVGVGTETNLCTAGFACTYFNTLGGAAAPQQTFAGVITSWRIQSGSSGGSVRLRVLRPGGPGRYTAVASSDVGLTASGVATFTSRVPIAAGDAIGVDNDNGALIFAPTAASTFLFQPALIDGQTGTPITNQTAARVQLLANATVEADIDLDGFGDETQDQCADDRTRQVPPCAPDFGIGTVTVKPARLKVPIASSKRVTIAFTLSRPATVTVTVEVRRAGRLVGGACIAPELAPQAGRCTQRVIVRRVAGAFQAGRRSVSFPSRGLPVGAHRVRVEAADATGPAVASSAVVLRVTR